MLTNTVGIMLFILAFTILASGGVLISKRLPRERTTDATPAYIVCFQNRILPLDAEMLDERLAQIPYPQNVDGIKEWVNRVEATRMDNQFFVASGQATIRDEGDGYRCIKGRSFDPKSGSGEPPNAITNQSSHFTNYILSRLAQKTNVFAYFLVYPDSVEAFRAARDAVASQFQMESGWTPVRKNRPVVFGGGGGIAPTVL